ncbi:MAG: DNA polymerase III subunit alpha [Candidatus Colwellbacteria bacterium]|nr:DNA polymerase III subunit alpha [Candidatus Colwellbacteria bacterium]
MRFVHLHTHSHYSLLDGLSKIEDLVARTKELGMDALAITDHGNLYGSVEFFKKAKAAGVKPIIGAELYLAKNSRLSKNPKVDNIRYHLTVLVKNQRGYENLCELITKSHLEGFYYKPRIDKELLEKHKEGLIVLSGCFSGEIAKLLIQGNDEEAESVARYYQELFGENYYLEIQPHAPQIHSRLIELGKKLNIPLVATQDSHYLKKEDAPIHEILLAIQTNGRLDDEERFSFREFDCSLLSPEEMSEIFKSLPEAIENTGIIADKCEFKFEFGRVHLPSFTLPEGFSSSDAYLKELATSKLKDRFPKITGEVKERLDYELGVIEKTGFADYFLIVQDFVNWAKRHGIVVGPGRGSAAGSLVSYVLGITGVDPLKYDLIFERFLNPDRISMPDIDLDFADDRRDEVLGYIKDTYGEERVSQIITFGTMAARASVRDAGRAMGLPYSFCDEIAKLIPFQPNMGESDRLLEQYLKHVPELKKRYGEDAQAKKLLDAAISLEGVARHASVHACGVVISKEPLVKYLPLQRAPQNDQDVITQIEFTGVEDLGLLKIDLLGLRNLTIIEETVKLVKEMRDADVKIESIPLDDKKTYEFLQHGETTGVFQFESSGMRRYMKDIKPKELEDLTVLVALYRPGPMELIPSFINRKSGREKVTYLHPKLEPILKNTYGIMIYQEQLLEMVRAMAGFTLAEADVLRKAVGKKIRRLLQGEKEKFYAGCEKNGVPPAITEKLWKLIEPFDRYGFNRAHAVCYALIGYQTAYLKANYPVEFMTALLNNSSGDVDRVAYIIEEANKIGIEVLPPDVNKSVSSFIPEEKNIRFGLLAIKNVGSNITEVIVNERLRGGPYQNLADFVTRIDDRDLNKKSMESLVKSGALDSLGTERLTVINNLDNVLKVAHGASKSNHTTQSNLFGGVPKLSLKLTPSEPATKTERLAWEKELLGLYVTEHPLKELVGGKDLQDASPVGEISKETSERKTLKTYGVISKIQRVATKTGSQMLFATIEDLSDTIEVLVFSELLNKDPSVWKEGNIVKIIGRISRRNGEPKLICNEVRKLPA